MPFGTPLTRSRRRTFAGTVLFSLAVAACAGDKPSDSESRSTTGAETPPAPNVQVEPGPGPTPPTGSRPDPIDAPEEALGGNGRVVNFAWKDGKPVAAIDVWATRSVLYNPIKLAENVAYGEASDWFRSPKGSPIRVFEAGAEPTPENALSGVAYARKGTHVTGMVLNYKDGTNKTSSTWDASENPEDQQTPDSPPAGKGYVLLRADQLKVHEESLTKTIGGWALNVGDGNGSCLRQRVEDMGFPPSLLGGTQPVKVDLDPGKHTISFHKRDDKECKKASKVLEVTLDVKADEAQTVMVYTEDTKTLKHLVLPSPVNKAKPFGANKVLREKMAAARAARKEKKANEKDPNAASQRALLNKIAPNPKK